MQRPTLLSILLVLSVAPTVAQTIETLEDPQGPFTTSTNSTVTEAIGTILGTERDAELTLVGTGGSLEVTNSQSILLTSTTGNSMAIGELVWDGADGTAILLDPVGLGGVNLTQGNGAFAFGVDQATAGSLLEVVVYSSQNEASQYRWTLPEINSPTPTLVPFWSFLPIAGSGADFSNVGAIVLRLTALNGATISLSGPITSTITAPLIQAIQTDLDQAAISGGTELGGEPAVPGGGFTYTITIRNTGDTAQSVQLSNGLDPNLSQIGAFRSTPLAHPDAYSGCGNVTLIADDSTPALAGLLANDDPVDGDLLSVVTIQNPTDLGGSVALDDPVTGRFTYDPPAGAIGTDQFTYVVEDSEGHQVTGRASVQLDQRVWFVDSSSGGPGLGTQADPFLDLTNLNGGGDVDDPGDSIVLFDGGTAYTGGLVLEDGQRLLGRNSTLLPCDLSPSGARPTLHRAAGTTLTLASSNSVDEIEVTSAAGAGLVGSSIGTASFHNTSVSASGGPAVSLTNGSAAGTFESLTSTGSPTQGIRFDGLASVPVVDTLDIDSSAGEGILILNSPAPITLTTGDVTGSALAALRIGDNGVNDSGRDGEITYGGTINNTNGAAVEVFDRTGGNVTLSGAIVDSGGQGITLVDNDSGSPTLQFSSTVDITNSSTTSVTVADNTTARVIFADLDIDNRTSNQAGILASNNGTASGSFEITTGTVDSGSGSAIDIDNTSLGVSLVSVTSNGGNQPGIDLATTTGSFTLTGDGSGLRNGSGGTIQNKSANAISLNGVTNISLTSIDLRDNSGSGIDAFEVEGFVLDHSIVTRNEDTGGGFSGIQAGLHLRDLSGVCSLTDTEVSESEEVNLYLVNEAASLTSLLVDSSLIELNDSTIGAHGLLVEGRSTGSLTVDITNSTIQNHRSSGVSVNSADSSTLDIDITSNSFDTQNNAVDLAHNSSSTFDFTVSGTISNPQTMLNGQGASIINVNLGTLGGTLQGTVDRNTLGTHLVAGSGTTGGSGVRVVSNGDGILNVNVTNNTIRGIDNGDGINVLARDGSNTLRVNLENNDVRTLAPFGSGIFVDNAALGSDTTILCLNARNNTAESGGFFGDIEIDNNQASATFDLERLVGVGNAANVAAHLDSENTLTGSGAFATIAAGNPVNGVVTGACRF